MFLPLFLGFFIFIIFVVIIIITVIFSCTFTFFTLFIISIIIFITGYGDIPMTVRAIKAGAVDFLTKPVPSKLLLERIFAVLQQQAQRQEQQTAQQAISNRLNSLTSREMELLPLVIAGHSNKEIARKLDVAESTVKIHLQSILKKLGVHNRVQAAIYAVEHGISASN